MSLPIATRFARRELRGGLRGFRIFLACLALGVAAIAAIGTVRSSIEAGLAREGAALLGGDAELDFTYRFAEDAERAWMEERARAVSEIADFRSMAVVGERRALTQIKAVDSAYPLVGAVQLAPDIPLAQAFEVLDGRPGAVMERVLVDRLGLSVGDVFMFGTQDFRLSATLVQEPDSAAGGFALGPRTIVLTESLANSSLLAPGTLFSTKYRLDLPDGTDLAAIEADARKIFADTGVRWSDARNGAPGVSEFVDRLGAFLVLVGLSGLAVGGVGVSSAVQAYLTNKTSVIATLRTLGADQRTIFQTYFIQIGVLTLLGIALGVVLGALLPLLLAPLLSARLPIPAEFAFYPGPLIEAAIYGLLTAFVFTLWPLARAEDVRAASLFRDALAKTSRWPAPKYIFATAAALAVLIVTAGFFSQTWQLTLWTAGGIALALSLLSVTAFCIRWLCRRSTPLARGAPRLRWALTAISGPREGAVSVVLSLGLGLSVLSAVGQIDGNLRAAITGNLPEVAPSYFFVDIQKDQMDGYRARLAEDPAVRRVDAAPMLRGIITRINGQPAAETAGDHWVLQGDRGVTYAEEMPDNTRLTAGDWWPANYDGPPLISFAAEEAEEMGLKIGDSMTVNILGRDITGTIASFREVDFSTAGIGFILSMNPSALSGAPHSFISTVYAEESSEATILRDLSDLYPNITAIRVRDAIDQVATALSSIAAATSYGAAVTLLTGFLVLIGAATAGTNARVFEASVLKTLGAKRSAIFASFALRSAILGTCAGLVALITGSIGGWAVSTYILDTSFSVIWPSAAGIILGGLAASTLAGLAFAYGHINARPAQVLRAQE
ncbi:MAG: FtsX-like permease family protein [Pseudomonadota bacterium]